MLTETFSGVCINGNIVVAYSDLKVYFDLLASKNCYVAYIA